MSFTFLGAFLAIILFFTLYFTTLYAAVGAVGLIVIEGILFLISWRIGPKINDWMYQWFFGLRWLSTEEFARMEPELAKFVKQICTADKIDVPKIGYIEDDNPQAFSYGSNHWNARVVFTRGILKYLDTNEKKSVLAHEVGHIVHRDFIVMTLASFLLTLLYLVGRILIRTRGRKNPLPLVGAVSLLFYYIGSYILLYLSRIREYYADYYSKQKLGTGNYLCSTLVKVAYGIMTSKDTQRTKELMEGTRTLGIYDHKHAPAFGLAGADYLVDGDSDAIIGSMVYDTHAAWAFWLELSSSHPLTGKRLKRLLDGERKPLFDISKVDGYQFDYARNRKDFVVDWGVANMWWMLGVVVGASVFYALGATIAAALGYAAVTAGLALALKAWYRYPNGNFGKMKVIELMSYVYASPVRGMPTEVDGELVGRGTPGYVFSEDLMFEDKTGILYLDYRQAVPLIGDLYFALAKVKSLIGRSVSCKGWFFRGFSQHLSLLEFSAGDERVSSRQRLLSWVGALAVVILGLVVLEYAYIVL